MRVTEYNPVYVQEIHRVQVPIGNTGDTDDITGLPGPILAYDIKSGSEKYILRTEYVLQAMLLY